MKELTIKYNPYTITTEFSIDGKRPKMDSSLNVGNSRLQEWADQLPNWLVKEYNDKNWDIQFTGTTDDFTDLLEGFGQNNAGVKAKFSTKRMPDVDETENYIKKIFDEIQRGPIKELKSKDIVESFEKAKNQEFEINVVATMSSGKSTLINALLGRNIMPSGNEATTATIVRITDDDNATTFKAKAYNSEGKLLKKIDDLKLENMQELNKSENVSLVNITGPIPFVKSTGMKLVLIDTPGPNNARNKQHEEMTYRMIAHSDKSLVLYVENAGQLGIKDNKTFLDYVCNTMRKGGKQTKDRFLFVVNKINSFNPEPTGDGPGCIRRALNGVKKDLEDRGIRNPNIFPVAALPALQLRENSRRPHSLNEFKDYSEDFEEMRFDQYNDFSHLPVSIQRELEDAKKEISPDGVVEIQTGIISLEKAISLYVKKYARTTKVMDLVLAFNNKLEELSAEASLREMLRKDQTTKAEMEKQIKQVRKNIETARKAQTFSAEVDKLDLVSGTQREVTSLFKGLRTDISNMMAGRATKVELSKAKQQCAEIEKKSQSIRTQLKVEVEKIIIDTYKNTVEDIITEYKKYLQNLNMEAVGDKLKLNPLKLVGSQLGEINIDKLMNAHKEVKTEKTVKVESYIEKTGGDTTDNTISGGFWGGIIGGALGSLIPIGITTTAGAAIGAAIGGWLGNKRGDTTNYDVKTRRIEIPQTTTYVNMSIVASEFLQPIQEELAVTEKAVLDYVKSETVEVKSFVNRKLQEIDQVLDSKLSMLAEYETGIKEKDAVIAERQKQLKWLEDIEKKVNSIVKY